jgi:hypothetical protein
VKDKTDGQQGDPLEMLKFNLTILNLWERVLTKIQEDRTVPYADDGYIKDKMNVSLQALVELNRVLKEDAGLEFNVSKVSILSKGTREREKEKERERE